MSRDPILFYFSNTWPAYATPAVYVTGVRLRDGISTVFKMFEKNAEELEWFVRRG
jgi:hypothetical protein